MTNEFPFYLSPEDKEKAIQFNTFGGFRTTLSKEEYTKFNEMNRLLGLYNYITSPVPKSIVENPTLQLKMDEIWKQKQQARDEVRPDIITEIRLQWEQLFGVDPSQKHKEIGAGQHKIDIEAEKRKQKRKL
jgi:hypothetical protein